VNMNLGAILTRKRGRPWENQDKAAVDHQTVTSPNRFKRGLAGSWQCSGKRSRENESHRTTNSDNRNSRGDRPA